MGNAWTNLSKHGMTGWLVQANSSTQNQLQNLKVFTF